MFIRGIPIKSSAVLVFILTAVWCIQPPDAVACPDCWRGYGPGEERYNKPLADLRIIFERHGEEAIQTIRNAFQNSRDHLVKQRAVTYILAVGDTASVPLLEDAVYDVARRVAWGRFGVGTPHFETREKAAAALSTFGARRMADRIWNRYDRMDAARKSEVPYLLSAMGDPRAADRVIEILENTRNHTLILGALDVLGNIGGPRALSVINEKIETWQAMKSGKISAGADINPLTLTIRIIRARSAAKQLRNQG